MKINPIYCDFAPKYNQNKEVSFRGDLFDLPKKEVIKRVKESLNNQYFIDEGTRAEVYRIKDSDYCVRVPHISANLCPADYDLELSPKDTINHVKAKLGFGATIMKYFDGVVPKLFKNNEFARHKFQEDIAKMPIKAYSNLLHQIAEAIDNDLIYDCSGGNLIVDTEKQTLTAIDFFEMSADNPRPVKPLNEIFSVITSYGTKRETAIKIMKNIINTGLEELKPKKIPCMDLALFDFVDLIRRVFDSKKNKLLDKKLEDSFEKLKQIKKEEIINKDYSPVLQKRLKLIHKQIKLLK